MVTLKGRNDQQLVKENTRKKYKIISEETKNIDNKKVHGKRVKDSTTFNRGRDAAYMRIGFLR